MFKQNLQNTNNFSQILFINLYNYFKRKFKKSVSIKNQLEARIINKKRKFNNRNLYFNNVKQIIRRFLLFQKKPINKNCKLFMIIAIRNKKLANN